MKSAYLLDTNTVSYLAKGRSPAARSRLQHIEGDELVCISAITEAELRYGLARRPEAHALHAAVEAMLFKFRILPWGSNEAAAYGSLRADLEKSGIALAELDLMLAAHAIAVDAIFVTNDRAFSHVKNLHNIQNWATDL